MRNPDVVEKLSAEAVEGHHTSPEQFAALIRTDVAKWAKVITATHVKADYGSAETWYGLLVPAATNRSVVQVLNAATLQALQTRETRDRFLSDGSEPVGNTPEEFRRFLVAEVDRWGKVVRAAAIKPE